MFSVCRQTINGHKLSVHVIKGSNLLRPSPRNGLRNPNGDYAKIEKLRVWNSSASKKPS